MKHKVIFCLLALSLLASGCSTSTAVSSDVMAIAPASSSFQQNINATVTRANQLLPLLAQAENLLLAITTMKQSHSYKVPRKRTHRMKNYEIK